jgi:hypothetical protein
MDGRDKPGHDEKATHYEVPENNEVLKILADFSVRLSG